MRASTLIVIFLIFINSATGLAIESGFAADAGIQPQACGFDELDKLENTVDDITASNGLGNTLFGVFTAIGQVFETVWGVATAAPTMVQCMGAPDYITAFAFAPLYLITAADVAYALSGRRL